MKRQASTASSTLHNNTPHFSLLKISKPPRGGRHPSIVSVACTHYTRFSRLDYKDSQAYTRTGVPLFWLKSRARTCRNASSWRWSRWYRSLSALRISFSDNSLIICEAFVGFNWHTRQVCGQPLPENWYLSCWSWVITPVKVLLSQQHLQ